MLTWTNISIFSDAIGNERLLERYEEENRKYYVFKISLIAFYKNVGLCPGSKGGGGYGFFVAEEGVEKNLFYFLKNKRLLVLYSVVNEMLFCFLPAGRI